MSGKEEPVDDSAPLLALVDRLAAMLDKGDLSELELASGGTTIIVRSQAALERLAVAVPAAPGALEVGTAEAAAAPAGAAPGSNPAAPAQGEAPSTPPPARPSVKAPLTGIYYGAPSPGATPYIAVGDHVQAGQIIGLIEAMKLFNEIKSDMSGRITRICVESGQLVKAKQPLIEVERA
jgi:acetyl-CoA carboxylase biotin carboxyl carrier protein